MDPPIQPDAPIQPDPPIQFPAQPNGPFPFPPYPQFANLQPNLLPAPSPEHFIAALLTRQIYRTLHERELRNQLIQQNVNILLNAAGNPHPVEQQQPATPGLPQELGYYGPQNGAGAGGPIRVHQENPFHHEIPRATDPYGTRPSARDRRQPTAEEEFARCSEAYAAVDQRLHHFCQQNGVQNKNQEEIFLFADYHRAAHEFYESFAKKEGFVRPDNQGAGPS
ncbi:unnamed protein product [Caenorhabditis brenneri]